MVLPTHLWGSILDKSIPPRSTLFRPGFVEEIVKLGNLAVFAQKFDESVLVCRFSEVSDKETLV